MEPARKGPEKKETGLLTLFCDVSFCPETGAAGYGAWYRTDAMERGVFFGGQVPVRCRSSNDGEFWGLVLALRETLARLRGAAPGAVVMQCDNIAALGWVRAFRENCKAVGEHHGTHPIPEMRTYPSSMAEAVAVLRTLAPGTPIWLKHVKGHDTKSKAARSWVNKMCDREARQHMQTRRSSLKR